MCPCVPAEAQSLRVLQGDRVDVNVSPMFIFLLRDGMSFRNFPCIVDLMESAGTVISIHTVPNLRLTSPISGRLRQRDTGLRNSADPSLLVHALLDLSAYLMFCSNHGLTLTSC